MLLIKQLLFGTILICLTVILHAFILDKLLNMLESLDSRLGNTYRKFSKITIITLAVLGVFIALTLEIWLWAVFYYSLVDAISNFEEALYFSTSTFTTVGYGDVILSERWRLVGSLQAANGFILFGWSTAFIFEVISKLYKNDGSSKWRA